MSANAILDSPILTHNYLLSDSLREKYDAMRAILKEMGEVVVGYSGGVDSTVVMKVAFDVLGNRAIAVTGDSEAFPSGEVDAAQKALAGSHTNSPGLQGCSSAT